MSGDDEDVPAPEETAAKDVLLYHRKWRLLDMEQMELLCLLQARYVAPREGDVRDAGLAAIALMVSPVSPSVRQLSIVL